MQSSKKTDKKGEGDKSDGMCQFTYGDREGLFKEKTFARSLKEVKK